MNAIACIFLERAAAIAASLAVTIGAFAQAQAQDQSAAPARSDAQARELQKESETLQKPLGQFTAERDAVSRPLPDAKSAGAKLVSTYCAQCHAAPTPTLHTAMEWSSVAQRMHMQMDSRWQSVNTPTEQEMDRIVAYMQKHARQ
ncbi:hypothetical protein QTH97_31975 [Variovorax sp. J22R24]|uniref:hypothetical protein n=1 Tax=Variovorax gracilis TaxID=3053502 RepID=UPI0025750D09|nr:hypothetical protein [Variovorax sp. J22R24]MDM0109580.1 hypothetical protein [Variovorax sp. J22R24]